MRKKVQNTTQKQNTGKGLLFNVISFANKLIGESDNMIMLVDTGKFHILTANNAFNITFRCNPTVENNIKLRDIFIFNGKSYINSDNLSFANNIIVIKEGIELYNQAVTLEKITQFKALGIEYWLIKVDYPASATNAALKLIYDNQIYKGITENALTGIFYADKYGNIIDVNIKVLELLGSPSAIATKAINVLTFPPLIEIGFSENFKKCVQSKTTICNSADYTTKWGKPISVNYSFTPIANRRGAIVGVLANIEDIDKQRRAELMLEESETNYKNLFNSSVDGIIISDLHCKILEINKRFYEMIGYSLEELNSIPLSHVIPEKWHTIERDFVAKLYQERQGTYEKEYIAKSGKVIPVSITAWVMQNFRGEDDKIGAIVQDITQRRDTTETLRKKTLELAERVKELNCLYLLSKIEAQVDASIQEKLQELVNILPNAMQCPNQSHFELIIEPWHLSTLDFKKNVNYGELQINVDNKRQGRLIFYIDPNVKTSLGIQLLNEEKKLLQTAVATIERMILKDQQEQELKLHKEKLEDLVALRTGELAESNTKLKSEIAYRKQAEITLREREAYYSDMFERNQAIKIIIEYETGIVVDANSAACAFYGYTKDEIKTLNIRDFYLHDQGFLPFLRGKIDESGSFFHNSMLKLHNNIEKYVTINASLVVHKAKKFIFCVISDITAQKAIETELLESENKFASIFNTITDALFLVDIATNIIVLVNPSACKLYKMDEAQLLSMKYSGLYCDEDTTWKQVTNKNNYFPLHWHKKGDGQVFPVEIKTNNFVFKTRIVSIIVVRDITERRKAETALRESEQRYREIADNAPSFVWETDKSMNFTYVSKGVVRILQYNPEEIIGKKIYEFCHDAYKHEYMATIEEAFALRRGFNEITKCYRVKNGGKLWLASFGMPVFDEKEQFIGFRGIDNDITERKMVHEAFQNALEKERKLNQLKLKFITTVSHEFRTPLTLISSNAQLIEKFYPQLDDAAKNKSFRRITETVKHMSLMLDNVSLIGKDESGVLEFNPVQLDIERFCTEVAEEIESIYGNEIPVKLNIHKAIGSVIVDKSLLQHIIRNLLTNAVKFSHMGDFVIFEIDEASGNVVELTIKDKGIGIPEEDLSYIFEPFHRGANTKNIKGTGLGMSIVKRCVELHNGTIHLESALNKGTKVVVRIPFLKFDS